jgi:drug/metabolite transporter (DMT)-like permease
MLLLTAVIWGTAFVFQRMGMDHIGPFAYSAARFSLGAMVLLPIAILSHSKGYFSSGAKATRTTAYIWGGGLAGLALFGGISFQQVGLVHTTAGKAGFITGLYVVIVPILGLVWRSKTTAGTWMGAALAAAGLYLLSITSGFTMAYGDALNFCGAFIWAAHVLILSRVAPFKDPLVLAVIQYATCAVLSWILAVALETVNIPSIIAAAVPILYGGVLSVGLAYTLQVVAQQHAHPAHAAVILSLETVFAALGGWLLLNEILSVRALIGCGLMLSGMLVSQLYTIFKVVILNHPRQ